MGLADTYRDYGYLSVGNVTGDNGEALRDKIINKISTLTDVRRIFDLGCGNGWLANQLAIRGYEVTAADLSESGIALAKKNYGEKVRFFVGGTDSHLVEMTGNQRFDLVLSSEVIEHLYCPAGLLNASAGLLKDRGYILLTTPYHGYLKNFAISFLGLSGRHYNPLWDGGHIKFFSPHTLTTLLESHGFSVVSFDFMGRVPFLWKSMICLGVKRE